MRRNAFLGLSVLVGWGSIFLAHGCSDDDPEVVAAGGGSSGGSAGASGNTGRAGAGAGDAGAAGTSGSGGVGGAAGNGGSGGSAGGAAGSAGNSSGGSGVDAGGTDDAGAEAFTLSSPAFDDNPGCGPGAPAEDACDLFPVENTGLGGGTVNVSPALDWAAAPAGTQSFAIALHDLANLQQGGDPFTHWVLWNIPGTASGLPANLPRGTAPGVPADNTGQVSYLNDDGFAGSGACGNVYEFVLYALDTATFNPPDATDPDAVQSALDDSDALLLTTRIRARSNPDGPCDN